MPKWGLWALLGITLLIVVLPSLLSAGDTNKVAYSEFMARVRAGEVKSAEIDNTNGAITGTLKADDKEFGTTGPLDGGIPDADLATLREQDVEVTYTTPTAGLLVSIQISSGAALAGSSSAPPSCEMCQMLRSRL